MKTGYTNEKFSSVLNYMRIKYLRILKKKLLKEKRERKKRAVKSGAYKYVNFNLTKLIRYH